MARRTRKIGPFTLAAARQTPKGEGLHFYEFQLRAPKSGRRWHVYRIETSPYLARIRFATVERHPGTKKR